MHQAPERRARARVARLLGATVAVAAVAGFDAARADAAVTAQVASGTLRISGDGAADRFALRLAPGVPGTLQLDLGDDGSANSSFDRSKFTKIVVETGDGADSVRIDEANGVFTNQEATSVNGQAGDDALAFDGTAAAETLEASASGGTFRLARQAPSGTVTARLVERVGVKPLGGADAFTARSLAASPVRSLALDLGADAAADTIALHGAGGAEDVQALANGTQVRITGLAADVDILGQQVADDSLTLDLEGGADRFGATGNLAALIRLTVEGGFGQDELNGSNGADTLLGDDGNDRIDGQQGNDTVVLGGGNDTFTWDPGDGSDTVEGGSGADALAFNGSAANERFEASPNGPRVRFTRDIGAIVMDLDDVERIDTHALLGTDTFTVNDLTGTDLTRADVDLEAVAGGEAGDGQADAVRVFGSNAAESVRVTGGAAGVRVEGLAAEVRIDRAEAALDSLAVDLLGGVDAFDAGGLAPATIGLSIDGGAGDETLLGSDGDETFEWEPGDGSDRIEGRSGQDALAFSGSSAAESLGLSANGARLRVTRNLDAVTMDVAAVETVRVAALGGTDTVSAGNLTGTGVTVADLDLGGADAQLDQVILRATTGPDVVQILADGTRVSVAGFGAAVRVTGQEAAVDRLVIDADADDDRVSATGNLAALIGVTIDGGPGADELLGTNGADVVLGGSGNDRVDGQQGNDVVFLGSGDDTFAWDPGDGSDTVEGQDGADRLVFNGSAANERFAAFANGGRVLFTRDIANIVMDLDDVELIEANALLGADTLTVNDLSGTDLVEVDVDLAGVLGGSAGDSGADNVIVQGTTGDDVAVVVGSGTGATVFGLPALVEIEHAEAANDRLTVNALAGDDVIEASGLAAGAILLTGDGGGDDDILIGGAGPDTLLGGAGDDVLLGGPGLDVLDGGPGDNVVIQD
jgi:Ca2+-binding RTX toxin-like protein